MGPFRWMQRSAGGHVWPGESEDLSSSGVAKVSAGIDASEEILKFFRSIAQAISSGIQANSGRD